MQDWAKWIIIICVGNHFIIFISVADPTACNFIHLLSFVKHSLILLILYLFCLFFFLPFVFLVHIQVPVFSSWSHKAGIMNTIQWSPSEFFQRSIIRAPHSTYPIKLSYVKSNLRYCTAVMIMMPFYQSKWKYWKLIVNSKYFYKW